MSHSGKQAYMLGPVANKCVLSPDLKKLVGGGKGH